MFWSARHNRIKARAKSLGDLMLLTKERLETMQFGEMIEVCHRNEFVDSYVDHDKERYGFFESDPKEAEFAFHVDFKDRSLRADGFHRYFMLQLTASAEGPWITFEVVPPLFPGPDQMAGPDAVALAAELDKFPGFMNMNKLRAKSGIR